VTTPAITVYLPHVSASSFASAGATAGDPRFRIGLNCAGAGGNVYVTLTDTSNPADRSETLSVKNTSTATNVSLQLLRGDGSIVSYGADSASSGTANQWLAGPASTMNDIPLTVRYLATGTATPGTVAAAATFTLSYQ